MVVSVIVVAETIAMAQEEDVIVSHLALINVMNNLFAQKLVALLRQKQ